MKKTVSIFGFLLLMAGTAVIWQGCSKSSSSSNSSNTSAVALSIQGGAQSIEPGGSIPFTAVLVDKSGNTSTPSSITWTANSAGGSSIGTFNGSSFTGSGIGYGTITASTTVNGTTLTASVPIGVYSPSVFAVVPSAVIWTTGAGTIPLTPVYLSATTTSPNYTYTTSDATIATVDGTGTISFLKAGSCLITVTASGLNGSPSVSVPVLVVGMPSATLPVMRVAVTPPSPQIFRGDNTTLAAKAYDMSGNQVSSSTFTWASQTPSVATVDATGKVTAVGLGKTVITATASGITGQAEVDVLPDTAIIMTPYWASIAPGATQQLTATAYKVDHTTKALTALSGVPITYQIPSYGIPMVDSIFGIATVSSTGLVTMKSSATFGISTFVLASTTSPTVEPGVSLIMAGTACDCGTADAGVANITTTASTATIAMTMGTFTYQINATAVDGSGAAVAGATLHFCSSNTLVANVDAASGLVTAAGPGTCTITICDGTSIQKTVAITVN